MIGLAIVIGLAMLFVGVCLVFQLKKVVEKRPVYRARCPYCSAKYHPRHRTEHNPGCPLNVDP